MRALQSVREEYQEAKEAWREIVQWARESWRRRDENGRRVVSLRNSVRLFRRHWQWWLALTLIIVPAALLPIFSRSIALWMQPASEKILATPATWLVPIAGLIILSIPPLFGSELVLVLVGLIWGLGLGTAIAAAGTLIGEILCFWLFMSWMTAKAQQLEDNSVHYGVLAKLMREGGVKIVCILRFSVLPGHIVTAVQSTVGMPLWKYAIAIVVSLPKQLVLVYIGVIIGQTAVAKDEVEEKGAEAWEMVVSMLVAVVTGIMSMIAMYIVYMRGRRHYPAVARASEARKAGFGDAGARVVFDASESHMDDLADVKLLPPGGRSEGLFPLPNDQAYDSWEHKDEGDGLSVRSYDPPPSFRSEERPRTGGSDLRRMPTGGHYLK